MVILGVAKIALALLFGGSLLVWLQRYPQSVLGVLLSFGGLELALVCRDQTKRVDLFIMILTAGACLAVNTAVGFAIAWALALLLLERSFLPWHLAASAKRILFGDRFGF